MPNIEYNVYQTLKYSHILLQGAHDIVFSFLTSRTVMSLIACDISTKNLGYFHDFLKKYSDLISSITILANDVLFLLGEILKGFPKLVGNTSFVILNIFGLMSLSFHIDLLKKTIHDMSFSKKTLNHRIFYITILKTFVLFSNIILLNLNFAASVFKLYNNLQFMADIYKTTKPFASTCLLLSAVLDCFDYFTNKRIINEKLSEKDIKIITEIYQNEKLSNKQRLNILSAEIKERMDKDTWKSFMQNLKNCSDKDKGKKLLENVVIKNIKTQSNINFSNLALKSLGYFAMFLCAWYPSTFIQASIFTFMSSLYTIQLIYQKYTQRNQQIAAYQIAK